MSEIARDIDVGMHINQHKLPVTDQVEAACEMLGLDPLYVANEGLFISIVSADVADDLLEKLHTMANGKNAAIIGEVVEDHPKQVMATSGIGGKRVVAMLAGEELPRIC